MSADEVNAALTGYTALLRFDLRAGPVAGLRGKPPFQLALTLANRQGQTRTLVFNDVQNLELNPNGERFDQMLELQVEDLSADGLDRIRFSVEELAGETLFLHCAEVRMEEADGRL